MVDKVKLYTLHSIKGLEAPVVFIAGINEGILPFSQELVDVERKLLYVGMTRAKQLLYLTSSKQRSSFIDEIEPAFLQLSDSERDHCFDISIEDYQFSDKLSQVHNGEEIYFLEIQQSISW